MTNRGRRSRPRSLCFCLCDAEELILHIDCQKRPRPQRVRKPQKRPEFSTVRVCVCDIYCYWLCSIEQIRLNWSSVTKLLTSQSSFDFHSTQLIETRDTQTKHTRTSKEVHTVSFSDVIYLTLDCFLSYILNSLSQHSSAITTFQFSRISLKIDTFLRIVFSHF